MNQKELREIRKRFKLDKDSISHVYGCYVNAAKDIVARMDMISFAASRKRQSCISSC